MCQGNWCVSGRREGGRWERGCAALGGDSCGVFVVSVDCSMLLRGVNASWIDRCCSVVGMVEPDESLLGVSHREEVNVSYCVGGGGGRGGGLFSLLLFWRGMVATGQPHPVPRPLHYLVACTGMHSLLLSLFMFSQSMSCVPSWWVVVRSRLSHVSTAS